MVQVDPEATFDPQVFDVMAKFVPVAVPVDCMTIDVIAQAAVLVQYHLMVCDEEAEPGVWVLKLIELG